MSLSHHCSLFFFFNDTATTEIYTLSLHDALPISWSRRHTGRPNAAAQRTKFTYRRLLDRSSTVLSNGAMPAICKLRSEEHTSELQSRLHLVCRLLLEKKKKKTKTERTRLTESKSS